MLLKVENLSIELGEFKLENASFGVEKGDYLMIIGPTGSGKTIILETIAGFYQPKQGRIYMKGKDITTLPPEKRGISMVYQDYMLFPHMSVYDNIAFGLRKKNDNEKEIKNEINHIAKVLEIQHLLNRSPTTLSGGEQQRVAIARALVVKPEILLMDEPFSSLDVKTRERMRKLVKNAMEEYDTTVIQVTHDFEDVFTLADKIIIMKGGKILQMGTPEEIFSKPANEFIANFVSTNLLRCKAIKNEDNLSVLNCNGVILYSAEEVDVKGEVTVSIRPEDIIISDNMVKSSAKNVLRAKVIEMEKRGNLVWVTIDAGIRLRVIITPNSAEALGIRENKEIYAIFKAASVKVIE